LMPFQDLFLVLSHIPLSGEVNSAQLWENKKAIVD